MRFFLLVLFLVSISCKVSKVNSTDKSIKKEENRNEIINSHELENKISSFLLNSYLTEGDLRVMDPDEKVYKYELIDLNKDGENEIFIYLDSRYFCGTGGCNFLIVDKSLQIISSFTVTRPPILVSNQIENGWRILYLWSRGYHKMVFNKVDGSYPPNPSVESEISESELKALEITTLFSKEKQLKTIKF